jgi:hypothetical protein
MLPIITAFNDKLLVVITTINDWATKNPELTKTIVEISLVIA